MSEKAFIRNLGHMIKDRDGNELNRDVTRVEYACRFYDFPVGQDTEVDADVARYVQSIHGGNGLNIVQPDLAVFGRKDAQQCAVIERMVHDLDLPVRLVFGETVRETDGVAKSSRRASRSKRAPSCRVDGPSPY